MKKLRLNLGLIFLLVFPVVIQACNDTDEDCPDNAVYSFECYDIMLSNEVHADDPDGRIILQEDADPWRSGEVVYIERDGLFMYRDNQGKWSRGWGFAAYYGKYDPHGVRPIPGQRYYCTQTACEYQADENGRLVPIGGYSTEVKVTTWNIGGFNNGNSGTFSVSDPDKYQAILNRFSPIIKEINADLIGFNEFLPKIYGERLIRHDLMGEYPYQATPKIKGHYMGKALFSRFPITNQKVIKIENSVALEADVTIGGRVFKVCICHPVWWNADGDPNWKSLTALAKRYKHTEHVILMGDFNFLRERERESLSLFSNAGFSAANMGEFGNLITTYNSTISTPYLDNIFVKGAEILSVSVIQITPEGLDPQNPQIEDETAWDRVNPSDHFPLTAKLLIK